MGSTALNYVLTDTYIKCDFFDGDIYRLYAEPSGVHRHGLNLRTGNRNHDICHYPNSSQFQRWAIFDHPAVEITETEALLLLLKC